MSTTALNEAVNLQNALMDLEFRGRGDREKSARHRLSKKVGVPEAYLYRLAYKAREMSDVKGEWYRRLKEHYEDLCKRNEAAADRYAAERELLKADHEATDKEHKATAQGVDAPEA